MLSIFKVDHALASMQPVQGFSAHPLNCRAKIRCNTRRTIEAIIVFIFFYIMIVLVLSANK
jgi:hypothetical protein